MDLRGGGRRRDAGLRSNLQRRTDILPTVLLACAIGIIAGLRSMAAPAVVSWAARLRWPQLQATPLAFMEMTAVAYLFTLLAAGELIADKLPFTPSRLKPGPLAGRLILVPCAEACCRRCHVNRSSSALSRWPRRPARLLSRVYAQTFDWLRKVAYQIWASRSDRRRHRPRRRPCDRVQSLTCSPRPQPRPQAPRPQKSLAKANKSENSGFERRLYDVIGTASDRTEGRPGVFQPLDAN